MRLVRRRRVPRNHRQYQLFALRGRTVLDYIRFSDLGRVRGLRCGHHVIFGGDPLFLLPGWII